MSAFAVIKLRVLYVFTSEAPWNSLIHEAIMFYNYRKAKRDISISLLLFTVLYIRWNNKIEFNKRLHRQNE
jgi:hypothetical protein